MDVSVTGTEFHPSRIEHGKPQEGVDAAVASALGALGTDREFSIASIRGEGPGNVRHSEFLATVDGVMNGLGGLEPPRQLVDLSFIPTGETVTAYVATQVVGQQPSAVGS